MTKHKAKMHLKVEHQTKGRIRLKVPAAKGNPELLTQIKDNFGSIPGVQGIKVNETTGSVTLFYDHEQHQDFHEAIAPHMPEGHMPYNEYSELAKTVEAEAEYLAEQSHFVRQIVDLFKEVDREIKLLTNNVLDLKLVLIVTIVGLTLFEVGPAAATPVWVTLVVFTLNHFVEMHPPRKDQAAKTAAAPALA